MKWYDRIHSLLNHAGWQIRRYRPHDPAAEVPDLLPEEREIIRRVSPFTYTGPARLASVLNAVAHCVEQAIPGDIVECGVWRGGSMMAAALQLLRLQDDSRSLWLYDTYTGMTAPTDKDLDLAGRSASTLLGDPLHSEAVACVAGLDDVRQNLHSTGYPGEQTHYIVGPVEKTIPARLPQSIALLRLDTDWYESTRHELEHLYPLLSPGGILILDDYGHWQGARRAADEFFFSLPAAPYLHRIDYTARCLVKPASNSN
ncbi:MAG: TylF/MycF/NovP-related O-methyltransferase [Candidatus Methylacidiphilales bacterium]|nr:TylF/MycF/NovP-related O-methyltransferase [Candidatus Methylacidiphilales bacterium]